MDTEKIRDFAAEYEIYDGHSHIFPDKIAEKSGRGNRRFL